MKKLVLMLIIAISLLGVTGCTEMTPEEKARFRAAMEKLNKGVDEMNQKMDMERMQADINRLKYQNDMMNMNNYVTYP